MFASVRAFMPVIEYHVTFLLFRQALNSSMLQPSQTPARAANGGFLIPNLENHIKNATAPIPNNTRIV